MRTKAGQGRLWSCLLSVGVFWAYLSRTPSDPRGSQGEHCSSSSSFGLNFFIFYSPCRTFLPVLGRSPLPFWHHRLPRANHMRMKTRRRATPRRCRTPRARAGGRQRLPLMSRTGIYEFDAGGVVYGRPYMRRPRANHNSS